MSKIENELKEYELLHQEILQKIELHNTLLTFTITTVVAILSFALTQKISYLYLDPLCVIIPTSKRIAYYRSSIIKISSYMIVHLENHISGINWETRNQKMISNDNFITNDHYECLILSIVCYVLYIINLEFVDITWINLISIIWPVSIIFYEIKVTYILNSVNKQREEWIKKWRS